MNMKHDTILRLCSVGFILLLTFALIPLDSEAQQLRTSNSYIFNPFLFNPGSIGGNKLTNVFLSHQQRSIDVPEWRSNTQFLNFRGLPIGKHENFAWGFNAVRDLEWTESRLGFNLSLAAAIINRSDMCLSLGVMGGFINWASRYDLVQVYDRTDDLLAKPSNFLELDAGFGGEYKYRNSFMKGDLNVYTQQMPGKAISKQSSGVLVFPYVFGGAGVLFMPVHNIFVGPRVFYRNMIMNGDTSIRGGAMDIGLKAELERQKLWFGGAYRSTRSALTVSMGSRIFETDTAGMPDLLGYFVDLNASFSLPMGQNSLLGPTIEMGVNISIGRNHRRSYQTDTIRPSLGSFWLNDGLMNDHLDKFLKPTAPSGLKASTITGRKSVVLNYEFDDNIYQYVGSSPEYENDTLISRLGEEWLGVDAFIENLVGEVIKEALTPDTVGISNPEVLEKLEGLVHIELLADLLVDEQRVGDLAKGMVYGGELGTNSKFGDSLFIKVVYNDADTVVKIGKDHQINNLELACLKLHAMRKKLEYELNKRYHDDWAIYWEGEKSTVEKTQGRREVIIKKPRITPNHPHQEAFQVNTFKLRFSRGAGASDQLTTLDDGPGQAGKRKTRRQLDKARKQIREKVF
jgi:hypothetical protein